MKKNIGEGQKFLIDRLGQIRVNAKISARDLSLKLGRSEAYVSKFEQGDFVMAIDTLFEAIEICGSTPEEFFCENIRDYQSNKEIIDAVKKLPFDKRKLALDVIKEFL